MKTIGMTGHQNIPKHAVQYVSRELDRLLREMGDAVIGFTSLAAGADQLFARAVLDHGGQLNVVVPSENYEMSFSDAAASEAYGRLLENAETIERLPNAAPSEEAYLEAGCRIVDLSDVVFAVWDGRPARGKGGTADVVEYARSRGKQIVVIWPEGVNRG